MVLFKITRVSCDTRGGFNTVTVAKCYQMLQIKHTSRDPKPNCLKPFFTIKPTHDCLYHYGFLPFLFQPLFVNCFYEDPSGKSPVQTLSTCVLLLQFYPAIILMSSSIWVVASSSSPLMYLLLPLFVSATHCMNTEYPHLNEAFSTEFFTFIWQVCFFLFRSLIVKQQTNKICCWWMFLVFW